MLLTNVLLVASSVRPTLTLLAIVPSSSIFRLIHLAFACFVELLTQHLIPSSALALPLRLTFDKLHQILLILIQGRMMAVILMIHSVQMTWIFSKVISRLFHP